MTKVKDREEAGFGLAEELRRMKAAKAGPGPPPRPRRRWLVWGLGLWAGLATALAVMAWGEIAWLRRPEPAPAAVRPLLPAAAPAVSPPAAEPFRLLADFEAMIFMQLAIVRREREFLAAEIENFRRLQAAGADSAAPSAASQEEENLEWVGLPPAPGVLYLDSPEGEAEFSAEAEAAAPPGQDLFFQPNWQGRGQADLPWADPNPQSLFFQSPPPAGARPLFPEPEPYLEYDPEYDFDPEAPAE